MLTGARMRGRRSAFPAGCRASAGLADLVTPLVQFWHGMSRAVDTGAVTVPYPSARQLDGSDAVLRNTNTSHGGRGGAVGDVAGDLRLDRYADGAKCNPRRAR